MSRPCRSEFRSKPITKEYAEGWDKIFGDEKCMEEPLKKNIEEKDTSVPPVKTLEKK